MFPGYITNVNEIQEFKVPEYVKEEVKVLPT